MSNSTRCVLGMDLGTSSLKCVIMDLAGRRLASTERSYPTQSPHPGWAEQNPDDWLEAMHDALAELRTREPNLANGLEAVGLCSAAHIPVLLDDAHQVIRPAILWSDQRSEAEVSDLRANHASLLRQIALNEAGCTWTLPQLLWIWNHEPDVLPRVCRLLSSKDYLIFRLTGEVSMDHASAAATLMLDGRNKTWSPDLIALSRLPAHVYPPLVDPMSIIGRITTEAARAFGLPIGVPVIAGTLDSAAEMVGCGLLSPGEAGMVRVGSAGGIMLVTDKPTFNNGIITYPHVVDELFYKQAGTNACATSLKWIRELCMTMRGENAPVFTYENLDQLAAEAKPGASGLMFHPYLQGERAPYWNPELRGCFTGIDQSHGWPQFVRAVMEGVAFSLLDCLGMFRRDGLDMTAAIMTGGVAKSQIWSQIIADVLGMNMRTIRHGDSALGVCMLSATAVGMFASIDDAVSVCVSKEQTIESNPANRDRYDRLFARYQETGRFLDAIARKFSTGSV
jgi:xylulokinase